MNRGEKLERILDFLQSTQGPEYKYNNLNI